jgi:pyruvate,orthophosphate dikinase
VFAERGEVLPYLLGTMIETPRAALVADSIGKVAEFFSFGTNDLTQMTLGFSRDDAAKFLPDYLKNGACTNTTRFAALTRRVSACWCRWRCKKAAVGAPKALRWACVVNTAAIPASVAFFHRAGLDYVSCSPYRVPIARLAAAQAAIGV